MAVMIAHARYSENGTAVGVAGDQTGKEVSLSGWYDGNWIAVYRPTDTNTANKIAEAMEQACANSHIGYSQSDRYSMYYEYCKCNGKIKDISTDCNCDCSSLVAVACKYAGLSVPSIMYTGNEDEQLMKTKAFKKLTNIMYTKSSDYLQRGDILLKRGHTAVVTGYGTKIVKNIHATESCSSKDENLAGRYKTTVECNARLGAGLNKEIGAVLPAGTGVTNYGFYSTDKRGVRWLFCVFYIDNLTYELFISEMCLDLNNKNKIGTSV